MTELSLVLPITKVDATQRLVYGLMTSAAPDKSDEALDYAASKPYFEAWSEEIAKASDGKSFGNVRAMHGNVAAGILARPILFDDAHQQMECCARIVDDQEWKKVEAGVYTGFSIGGAYVKRYRDGAVTRYVARPSEVSLVDNPCNPDAVFQLVKQDGSTEARRFTKEGKRNSAADLAHIQAVHRHAVALGACCDDRDQQGDGDETAKAAGLHLAKRLEMALAERTAERDGLLRTLGEVTHTMETLAKRLEIVERQPLAAKGVVVAIDKARDSGGEADKEPGLLDRLAGVGDPRERANLLLARAGYVPAEDRR